MIRVLPISHQLESRLPRQPREARRVYLYECSVVIYSPSWNLNCRESKCYDLCAFTHQVHFDSPMGFVIWGMMTECREIEIRTQFTIGPRKNAKVELGRDPFSVIVGRLQNRSGLLPVNADQQASIDPTKEGDISQKGDRRNRIKVTDRRSWKERHGSLWFSTCMWEFRNLARNRPPMA